MFILKLYSTRPNRHNFIKFNSKIEIVAQGWTLVLAHDLALIDATRSPHSYRRYLNLAVTLGRFRGIRRRKNRNLIAKRQKYCFRYSISASSQIYFFVNRSRQFLPLLERWGCLLRFNFSSSFILGRRLMRVYKFF